MIAAGRDPSLLQRTVATTRTEIWNDSCAADELEAAIARGASGATSNPSLVLDVLRKEPEAWRRRVRELAAELPSAGEADIAWRIAEEVAVRGARLLEPVFERTGGRQGRLSIQVDPSHYRDAGAMVAQAVRFAALAPNLQVKLPVTSAGLTAIEEATALGIPVNATVNFTVAGALAVADAVERGLDRRAAAGHEVSGLHPVCTLMAGRLEDWLRASCERDGILVTPGRIEWSGVAVFKRAYALYRERGYRTRLLGGAFRNHLPFSQLVRGDIVLTIPPAWQLLLEASGLDPVPRIDEPVDGAILAELLERVPEFRPAYEPDGLASDRLEMYGAAVRTLRQFIAASHELQAQVRDVLLPDPDRRVSEPVTIAPAVTA
jgi:transaldolase